MNKALLNYYRLSSEEYQVIQRRLDRAPSRLELSLFSALWNEHCSYKSSAVHLKKLHFPSDKLVAGEGENAGVVDLGEGEKVAFKVESHNHPSRITPYHGAGTGVGGILRDVFVMGARPIALANYLCFGPASYPVTADLVDGVVRGIGDYGNCIGIPVVTGQTEFHSSYKENTVVNAAALGYFGPKDKIISSKTNQKGMLMYVGAHTGRDGIHGASMASKSFSVNKEDTKTCVQIGDPFYGKLLMEALLEVMRKDLVLAAQDMGAAGLTSSSVEMAVKSKMGFLLYLDQVPLRDLTMKPEDILLSESQERALLVVDSKNVSAVKSIFDKWNLPAQVIGQLTEESYIHLLWKEKTLLKISSDQLKAPQYHRPFYPRPPLQEGVISPRFRARMLQLCKPCSSNKYLPRIEEDSSPRFRERMLLKSHGAEFLLSLLKDERGCDRQFIYRQYDQRVGTNTVKNCHFPFAVLRLPHSGRALGFCLGGRPHIMRLNAFEGGKDSVYEPALQLAARGFTPLALTDGLNFGSPENKKIMTTFVDCVDGLAEASRALQTPVVSGNVSFYNETKTRVDELSEREQEITGTPVTALIGLKKSLDISASFVESYSNSLDDLQTSKIYLLSAHQLCSTGLAGEICQVKPNIEGSLHNKVCQQFVQTTQQIVQQAPPQMLSVVGKFGLAYTLARMILRGQLGVKVKTQYDPFQERLYEIIVVLNDVTAAIWKEKIKNASIIKLEFLGEWNVKPYLHFNDISLSISQLKTAYESGWNAAFKNTAASL